MTDRTNTPLRGTLPVSWGDLALGQNGIRSEDRRDCRRPINQRCEDGIHTSRQPERGRVPAPNARPFIRISLQPGAHICRIHRTHGSAR